MIVFSKIILATSCLGVSLSLFPLQAQELYMPKMYAEVASYYSISPAKLYAKAIKASAITNDYGHTVVWPWTIHIATKAYQFSNKQQAIAYALANKTNKDLKIGIIPVAVVGLTDLQIIQLLDPVTDLYFIASEQRLKVKKFTLNKSELASLINKIAFAQKIDPLLISAIINQESGFNPNIVSKAGAVGLMQIMPATGRSLGISRNQLNNPAINIAGGITYFKQQLAEFGRLDLALAAYNAGPSAVKRYGGIPPYSETKKYVKSIQTNYLALLNGDNNG